MLFGLWNITHYCFGSQEFIPCSASMVSKAGTHIFHVWVFTLNSIKMFYCHSIMGHQIMIITSFYSWHDNTVVMLYAKFYNNHTVRIWLRGQNLWNFALCWKKSCKGLLILSEPTLIHSPMHIALRIFHIWFRVTGNILLLFLKL